MLLIVWPGICSMHSGMRVYDCTVVKLIYRLSSDLIIRPDSCLGCLLVTLFVFCKQVVVAVTENGYMNTILIMHFGGGQVRGSEVCLIESIEALSEAGFNVVIIRKDKILDEAVLKYVDAIQDEPFPEIMFDGKRSRRGETATSRLSSSEECSLSS